MAQSSVVKVGSGWRIIPAFFTAKFALKIGRQLFLVVIACSQTTILNASSGQEKPKQLLTASLMQRGSGGVGEGGGGGGKE